MADESGDRYMELFELQDKNQQELRALREQLATAPHDQERVKIIGRMLDKLIQKLAESDELVALMNNYFIDQNNLKK